MNIITDANQITRRIDAFKGRIDSGSQKVKLYDTFGKEQTADEIVDTILEMVQKDGDKAVAELIEKIDGVRLDPGKLLVSDFEFSRAAEEVPADIEKALQLIASRIEAYAAAMMPEKEKWFEKDRDRHLGVRFSPIEYIGSYVPGGLAGSTPLISSVLMNLIPAKVAGVRRIIVATPCRKDGTIHPYLLRACQIAGATDVYKAGGAQAIAAMGYGTASFPAVNKITGPGNDFVQLAKIKLLGKIDIDMVAGPSEIAILADNTANPVFLAADLISQAEHAHLASSMLFSDDKDILDQTAAEIDTQLQNLPNADIARENLDTWGGLCLVNDMKQGTEMINRLAPEHLELCCKKPREVLRDISSAGAVFLGNFTPEPVGDYTAGPSHTLPTNGAACFTGGITVYTYLKSSSLIEYTKKGLEGDLAVIQKIARAENLEGHARSAEIRLKD